MKFLNPLGFLALLAIPVLILIYIIKSKYTEQTVTSTYLWTLSEKFLKRRNPIRKITGIISLILQILAVLFIALAIAHPVFTLPGKAQDYCFILDGSGSMQTEQGGTTRFNVGKGRISDIISSAADGSTFTLITTGDTTDMVMKEVSDKKSALRQLDAVKPSYAASNLSGAVTVAQKYFEENKACKFIVFSDKKIEETSDNVQFIRISDEGTNCALDEVKFNISNSVTTVTGKVFAYVNSAEATVNVYIGDGKTAAATAKVDVRAGEDVDFSLTVNNTTFTSLRVTVTAQGDVLKLDDEVVLYNSHAEASYKTLIVSETPFFIEATLKAMGHTNIDIINDPTGKSENPDTVNGPYTDEMRGYGLYVFQNYVPNVMPEDGAVWFIHPPANVENSGFSYSDKEEFENPVPLKFNKNTSTKVKNLLKNTVQSEEIKINEYVKCGTYRSFTTLMTCGGDPVIMAGSNTYGNREVVFAFDFVETSDFVLSYSGGMILRNLVGYTFPDLVDETLFYCGENLLVNVLANCTDIRIERPSGKPDYLVPTDAISEYELTEVGEYTVIAIFGNDRRQEVKVFAQLPVEERTVTSAEAATFKIEGEPSARKRDGKYEDLLYAFIILAVIVVADWAVYCYEQYQLR